VSDPSLHEHRIATNQSGTNHAGDGRSVAHVGLIIEHDGHAVLGKDGARESDY
jgi:hypothetical protein